MTTYCVTMTVLSNAQTMFLIDFPLNSSIYLKCESSNSSCFTYRYDSPPHQYNTPVFDFTMLWLFPLNIAIDLNVVSCL